MLRAAWLLTGVVLASSALCGAQTSGWSSADSDAYCSCHLPSLATSTSKPDEVFRAENAVYWMFIGRMAEEHVRVQKLIRETPPGATPIIEGSDLSTAMDIRIEDVQMFLVLVLQAAQKISENEKESNRLLDQWRRDHSREDLRMAQPDPRVLELAVQHDAIIENFRADLEHELGDSVFCKVDAFVKSGCRIRRRPHNRAKTDTVTPLSTATQPQQK